MAKRTSRNATRGAARQSLRDRAAAVDQRHLDVAGIGLLALAVYLGLVLYGGWDGGAVGGALADGSELGVGALSVAVPAGVALAGLLLVLRPLRPGVVAPWAGLAALTAGLALAFAAGTAGLGEGAREAGASFAAEDLKARGGAGGEVLYWASVTLFQRAGAHVMAIALTVVGVLLVSGSSVAGTLRAVADGWRRAREAAPSVGRDRLGGDAGAPLTEPLPTVVLDGDETVAIAAEEEPTDEWEELEDLEEAVPVTSEEGGVRNFDGAVGGDADTGEDGEPDAATPAGKVSEEPEEEDVPRTPMGHRKTGVTESEERSYSLPAAERSLRREKPAEGPDTGGQQETAKALLEALGHFGVDARLVGIVSGPSVSRFELRLAPGTKVSKVSALKDDLAYALASTDIRILAPIPGKQAVGVEVPNARRRMVRLGDIYSELPGGASPLACWLGKDISGSAVWTDLARMPHVLVAGTTGSGKSGCVNAILSSMLLHSTPNDLRLVLVDPKRVELNHYERVPHLLTPVVTNPKVASMVLQNLIVEMENRYGVMGEARARNLGELNKVRRRDGEPPLPHILCVIDELADLMMVAPAEVEDAIIRLAQKSRAVGIHLLLATQRPSTDIITGTIKVNIPARIAFAVSSQVDSRVILDQGGAESLLGQGDMLFRPVGSSKLQRIQGAFITEEEIARITGHWQRQGEPEFAEELLEAPESGEPEPDDDLSADRDELLEEAIRVCLETQTASVSMIQRRLRVGYTRAGRLIDMLERRGVISGYEGSKARQVLITHADVPRILAAEGGQSEGGEAREPEPASTE